ncbi:MAG: hypothetical protein DRO15_07165 [Thermoprotei archaeon]|nr:MAG: hypothetical protein DRO15_07165 [Thermoprotei archaeon]
MSYLTFEDAVRFHGHIGPYLAIGYRAGTLARNVLKPRDIYDMYAEIHVPLKRPYTCIADGVQCSTSCTLGKLNIKLIDSNELSISFFCKSSNRKLVLRVKEFIIDEISRIGNLEKAAKYIMSLSPDELFDIANYLAST